MNRAIFITAFLIAAPALAQEAKPPPMEGFGPSITLNAAEYGQIQKMLRASLHQDLPDGSSMPLVIFDPRGISQLLTKKIDEAQKAIDAEKKKTAPETPKVTP